MTASRSNASRDSLVQGVIIAGVILAASVAIKLISPGYLSPELAQRLFGVLIGAMVVFYANSVPKALAPYLESRCDPAAGQAIRRFTGWTLALGGLAYLAASVVAPAASATMIAAGFLGLALLLVIARIAWSLRKGSHA